MKKSLFTLMFTAFSFCLSAGSIILDGTAKVTLDIPKPIEAEKITEMPEWKNLLHTGKINSDFCSGVAETIYFPVHK